MAKVKMIPVVDILRNITHSMDFDDIEGPDDWFVWLRVKSEGHNFWGLVDIILDRGSAALDPVLIDTTGLTYDGWYMGNGHHRVAAAILTGLDEMPVLLVEDSDDNLYADDVWGRTSGGNASKPAAAADAEVWCAALDLTPEFV